MSLSSISFNQKIIIFNQENFQTIEDSIKKDEILVANFSLQLTSIPKEIYDQLYTKETQISLCYCDVMRIVRSTFDTLSELSYTSCVGEAETKRYRECYTKMKEMILKFGAASPVEAEMIETKLTTKLVVSKPNPKKATVETDGEVMHIEDEKEC